MAVQQFRKHVGNMVFMFDFLVINFTKSMSIAHSLETDACKRFNGVHFNHLKTTVEEKLLLQTLT